MAYKLVILLLQTPIRVFAGKSIRNTTLGRVFFNEILPEDYPFDNGIQTSKHLKKVMADIFNLYGADETVRIADELKALSFEYETIASISTCMMTTQLHSEIQDFISPRVTPRLLLFKISTIKAFSPTKNATLWPLRTGVKSIPRFLTSSRLSLQLWIPTLLWWPTWCSWFCLW